MQGNEVTWALVALTAVQVVHAIFTGLFAAMESRCRRQLRAVKDEIARMREQMSKEGKENRQAIAENRQAIKEVGHGADGGENYRSP